ncbi:MAG: aspartate kinase [Clostridiales bacterium]|nr:aspartate kinase [Clostridiales bacterium]
MHQIIVQKYGGTSVQDTDRIKNTAKRIKSYQNKGYQIVVVVSAMGKTTDSLLSLASEISNVPPRRELDVLLSTGEQISMALLSMALNEIEIDSISLTGSQCGIKTDSIHSNARIENIDSKRILSELNNKVVIVAGFQGINKKGDITTLGRGGSDTSAVALAIALNAEKCEIYTDVDGIYSADPRIIKNAKKLDTISYDEMLEMAKLGAQVLHPRSVELAKNHQVKLEVKSSLNNNTGTKIIGEIDMEKIQIRGITSENSIARISITKVPDKPGIAYKLFKTLSDNSVSIDMILQNLNYENVNDISFTTPKEELDKVVPIVKAFAKNIGAEDVIVKDTVAKVSLIGTGILGHGEVASMFFEALSNLEINIEMISTSETKISCIIDKSNSLLATKKLHEIFFES